MERASTNPLFLFRRLHRVGVQLNAGELLPNSLSGDCEQEALDEFTSMNIGDTAESESETAVSTRQHPFHSTFKARAVQSRDGTVASTLVDPSEVCGTTSDVVCPDDPLSSNLGEGTADDPCSHLGEHHIERSIPKGRMLTDFELLNHTLVIDRAVPAGYLEAFLPFEHPVRRAAERRQQRYMMLSEAEAAMKLEQHREQQGAQTQVEQHLSDQLVMLAELKPRRLRTRWQKMSYDGPTGRRDAEQDLRTKGLCGCCQSCSEAQIRRWENCSPSNVELLGAGRRASTLRSRIRAVQSFWAGWPPRTGWRLQTQRNCLQSSFKYGSRSPVCKVR